MSLGQRIGLVSLLSLLTNIAAFGKNMAIAARFGVSGGADLVAYGEVILLFLPTILLIRECFGLFVSVYGRLLNAGGSSAADPLFASGLRLVAAIGMALTLVALVLSHELMRLIAPGLPPEQLERGAWLLRWISPALLLQQVSEFTRFVHNAHHRYAVPGLVLLGGNLLQMALLIAMPAERAMTAWVLAVNCAAFLQAAILLALAPGIGSRHLYSAKLIHPELRRMMGLLAPVAAWVILIQLGRYIERVVLSYLPEGSMASIAYMRKLTTPIQTILAASLALPIYVEMSLSRSVDNAKRAATFSRALDISFFLFLPLTAFIFLLASEIVELAFMRGEFNISDVETITPLLRIGVFVVIPTSLILLLRDFFYASARTRPLILGGAIQLIVTAAANILLAPRYGIAWIPAGLAAGAWFTSFILMWIVRHQISATSWRGILTNGLIVLAAVSGSTAAMIVALALPHPEWATGSLRALWSLMTGGIALLFVYCVITSVLRHPVAMSLIDKLRKKEARSSREEDGQES